MTAKARKTFCFDLDGTLCTNTWGDYESARPFPWAIERVNALARAGHRILVFTARGGTTGIDWRERTEAQLRAWGVRYDELIFGKPTADVYVDDRTVHVDAWRYGEALAVSPRADIAGVAAESSPVLPPPRSTTIVEVGRTFRGELFRVEDHARRVLAVASAHGIPTAHTASQIVAAVERAIEPSRELLAANDDVVFTIGLAGPPHAAYLDTLEDGPDPSLTIGCRLLSQAAGGLARYLRDGGIAAGTSAAAGTDAWPLRADAAGVLRDLLGGDPVVASGRRLKVRADDPSVALAQTLELAASLGLPVDETAPTAEDAREADEVLVVGAPFCVLPVALLDGQRLGAAAPGPVALELLRAWSESTGADLRARWSGGAVP